MNWTAGRKKFSERAICVHFSAVDPGQILLGFDENYTNSIASSVKLRSRHATVATVATTPCRLQHLGLNQLYLGTVLCSINARGDPDLPHWKIGMHGKTTTFFNFLTIPVNEILKKTTKNKKLCHRLVPCMYFQ